MILLIDGDHLTYRCAASCEPTKAKPFLEPLDEALTRVDGLMNNILTALNTDEYELYISGEGNWRYAIYPEYKANRKDKPKPTYLEDVREHLVKVGNAQIVNDIEVDDMCAIRLTQCNEQDVPAICVSLDKDLLTVPGRHYNFVTQEQCYVSPLQAMRRFYGQLISGDGADNIPSFDGKIRNSVPKFVQTHVSALDEMTEEEEMYSYCMQLYEDEFGNPLGFEHIKNIMHRNAKVLYMKRTFDDMWKPPASFNTN